VAWLLKKCRRILAVVLLWFARVFLKLNRLENIDLIDLGAPMEDVISAYGDPIKSERDEKVPDAIVHTFSASPFHEAVVVQWNGSVSWITYWSAYPNPDRDLKCMLKHYGKDLGWDVREPGYLCVRKDGKVWLRGSVAPALSVETIEYLKAKQAAAERH
jgi:hypothetical protein